MGLNLKSTIELNSERFEKGMDHVKESVSESVKSFVIGAVGVGTLEEAFHKTIETATELVNTAQKLDATVEQVQVLSAAAKDAGQSIDTVSVALQKLDEMRAKALGGDFQALTAFQKLGVNAGDLRTKSAADLFMQNISATVRSTNAEQIMAPLKEVLGRGGGEAVGILKNNFEELGDEMQKTGQIMDSQTAAKLKVLGDEMEIVSRIIVAQLGPALLHFAEWAYRVVLKGGGTIAGASAELGSEVGQAGFFNTLAANISKVVFAGGKMLGMPNTPTSAQIDKTFGINADQTKSAFEAAADPWRESLKEFEDRLNSFGKQIAAPKAPNFSQAAEITKRARPESDALVRVGNFLGSNVGAVHASSMLVIHARATAENTKQIAKSTEITAQAMGRFLAGMGPVANKNRVDDPASNWPQH